jgi:hypothetical protein
LPPITPEKRSTILKLQEAIGRSDSRLRIIKSLNKRESTVALQDRLKIPQPTISKAIARFETYGLVQLVGRKGNSEVYDRTPMLKQIGDIDRWLRVELQQPNDPIKPTRLKLKLKLPSTIPYLDSKTEADALKMANSYALLYLFENSLRGFINNVLSDKYTQTWWTKIGIKNEIIEKVTGRKRLEGLNKWHVPRGAHEIYYTDLEDLTYFLRKEKDTVFKDYVDVDLWDTTITKVVKLSRNIVDHHNPLPQREVNRLRQILEDWIRQLR